MAILKQLEGPPQRIRTIGIGHVKVGSWVPGSDVMPGHKPSKHGDIRPCSVGDWPEALESQKKTRASPRDLEPSWTCFGEKSLVWEKHVCEVEIQKYSKNIHGAVLCIKIHNSDDSDAEDLGHVLTLGEIQVFNPRCFFGWNSMKNGIMWWKQCHKAPIWEWFTAPMVMWGIVDYCFNHIMACK